MKTTRIRQIVGCVNDMKQPNSADPVARESTRVACAGVADAQASLDPKQLREWFKAPDYGAHAFGFIWRVGEKYVQDMEACFAARDQILPSGGHFHLWHFETPFTASYVTPSRSHQRNQRNGIDPHTDFQ